MAEERVVIEVDLRVEGKELVVFGGDEGVDLQQRRVGIDEGFVEALEESDSLVDLRRFESKRESELARLPCAEADGRIDAFFEDGVGRLRGDFFNLHAARL